MNNLIDFLSDLKEKTGADRILVDFSNGNIKFTIEKNKHGRVISLDRIYPCDIFSFLRFEKRNMDDLANEFNILFSKA